MSLHRASATVLLVALSLLVAAGCGSDSSSKAGERDSTATTTSTKTTAASTDTAASKDPADALTVTQLAGELVMTKLVGPTIAPDELAAIKSGVMGGIILFGPNVTDATQLLKLTADLNAARGPHAKALGLPPGMLISVDQEGGAIRNIPFAPPESTQPEIAGRGDQNEPRAIGTSTGQALGEMGVNMVLGPVADLVEGPNRTMAGRSFGSEGADVAPLVSATIEGEQQRSIASVAKHFPGFGASSQNSDNGVARIALTKQQLEGNDLLPFKAAIHSKVDVIMVSHGLYAAYDSEVPAILEPKIVTDLLRDQLGFDGVAMTDSMNAKGFRDAWGSTVPAACPAALKAGIDLLLLTGSLETATLCRRNIIEAVQAGTLSAGRVREAARRVEALRTKVATGSAPVA
jgi:beta-N-acetylhexosaminidase